MSHLNSLMLLYSTNYCRRVVLPETLRRGPYAMVERTWRAKPPSLWGKSCLDFCYFFRPLYMRNELPQFLLLFQTLVFEKLVASIFATFLDPSMYEVTPYEIMGGGWW